ncbi:MAG TPA: fibronectin type III domain-containing protein [Thermoanaerobaculia bacterium]|nr:fibronectin type III domain-containing protein [Thermoanaerobaculia bacterium]
MAESLSVTATSAADPSKSAPVPVQANDTQTLPPVPRMFDGAYVAIQSPVSGMHFTAPATIRMYADPFDAGADDPDALTVTFLMNGLSVGTYTGDASRNGYFPFTVSNVAAGTYTITARITTTANSTVTSAPVTVFVDNPPASTGPVFNLASDVVLSGSQNASYAGTPGNRCTINGNGFQIRSTGTFTGSLNITNCVVRGLGTATNPAIDVTVSGSGSIQLTGNVFDTFGTVSIGTNDQAQAAVRNNEFRENTLVPVTPLPTEYASETLPVFQATGNSSVQKLFQGNNVGLSTVVFTNTQNWLIGGNTDAESNVLMGVRCGFTINASTNMVLRGNYSQHNYPHRFSQGLNFELQGDGFLAEHNVIRSSSWPVRGMGGELRYNLIDASGNTDQVFQAPASNVNIHHNIFIFTVSQTFFSPSAGLSVIYNADHVQFHNNTMDGGGTFMTFYGSPISVEDGSFIGSLRNDVFYNFATQTGPIVSGSIGEPTSPPPQRLRYADYNDFFNPDASDQTNYGLSVFGVAPGAAGYGMHDVGGFNGHVNPKFTQPTAIPFPFAPEEIWTRSKKVSDVLTAYRLMYTPAAGSPLIGAGDPQDGLGGNVGAVGNGEAADQFGRFSTATPGTPVGLVATATGSSSVAISWNPVSGQGIQGYVVRRRGSRNGSWTQLPLTAATSLVDNAVAANAAYEYEVQAVDTSNNASAFSAPDVTTTVAFSDDPLVPGTTAAAAHVTQLRNAVDALLTFGGLSTVSWTDPAPAGLPIRAIHVEELRSNLTTALTTLGYTAPVFSDEPLQAGVTLIKRIHISELRSAAR